MPLFVELNGNPHGIWINLNDGVNQPVDFINAAQIAPARRLARFQRQALDRKPKEWQPLPAVHVW